MAYENIPLELREGKRWVCRTPAKIPITPTGGPASHSNPNTWCSFEEAVAGASNPSVGAAPTAGIGRVFVKDDGYTCIDLDWRDDPTTQARHKKILEAFQSYAEISQSGKGHHIVCRGSLPGPARKRDGVEMYDSVRYIILTGDKLPGRDAVLNEQPLIDILYTELGGNGNGSIDNPVKNGEQTESDADICERLRAGTNGAIFDLLFAGAWDKCRGINNHPGYNSASDADNGLCNYLGQVTDNAEQLIRIWLSSGMVVGREKKCARPDYQAGLVRKAFDRKLSAYGVHFTAETLEGVRQTASRLLEEFHAKGGHERGPGQHMNGKRYGALPPAPTGKLVIPYAEFIAAYRPLEYVLGKICVRGSLYTTTASTGAGKTTWLAAVSLAVASGDASRIGMSVRKGAVVYLTFENPDDFRMKLYAAAVAAGMAEADLEDHYIIEANVRPEVSIAELRAMGVDFTLVIVDTLQAAFDGTDFNNNKEMLDFIRRCRAFTELPGNPTLIVAAHPIKNAQPDNLLPYGGGSVMNEIDGNLTMVNDKSTNVTKLHWQGKFRGPEFEPISYHISYQKCDEMRDAEGNAIWPPVIGPVSDAYVSNSEDETEKREMTLLQCLKNDPGMTLDKLAEHAGYKGHTSVLKALERMVNGKLVEKVGRKYAIANRGKRALDTYYGSGNTVV